MKQKLLDFIEVFTGARKTIVMVTLMLVAIIFRIKGLMTGGDVVELLKGTAIAFFSANGLEHIGTTIKEYVNNKGEKILKNDLEVTES